MSGRGRFRLRESERAAEMSAAARKWWRKGKRGWWGSEGLGVAMERVFEGGKKRNIMMRIWEIREEIKAARDGEFIGICFSASRIPIPTSALTTTHARTCLICLVSAK